MTQTPASGPFAPRTAPPMSAAPTVTAFCAHAADASSVNASDNTTHPFLFVISAPERGLANNPETAPGNENDHLSESGAVQERTVQEKASRIRAEHPFAHAAR